MSQAGRSYEVTPFSSHHELECDMQIRMVAMRDGTRLHTFIHLPPGLNGPVGTVLWRTPYFRRDRLVLPDTFALQNGFAAVYQCCRGTAFSEGEFFPTYMEAEELDAEDTINWILQQPWSNGRIALMGSSYSGRTQWAAAFCGSDAITGMKPHVAALYGCSSAAVPGGGSKHAFMVAWALSMHHRSRIGHDDLPDYEAHMDHLPVHELDVHLGYGVVPFYRDFIRTTQEPATWGAGMDARFPKVKAPALISGGWFDSFLQENIQCFRKMKLLAATPKARNFTRMILGPWAHSGLINPEVFGEENDYRDLVPLQDRFIRNSLLEPEMDPVPEQPPVRYFMMGTNDWRSAGDWPPAHREKIFFLQKKQTLADMPEQEETSSSCYTYDPADPTPSANKGCYDRRDTEKRGDLLIFTTPILASPLAVAGNVRVRLFARSSAPDTDFFATLSDVYPDGRSMFLQTGMVRARFSRSLEYAEFLAPGEIREYEIDLGDTANTFLPGHAVRLAIHSASYPAYSRNMNTASPINEGVLMAPAQQEILHSGEYPSCLILPELN